MATEAGSPNFRTNPMSWADLAQVLRQMHRWFQENPYVGYNLFDANTILKADTDNTPTALTVNENSFVGRAAGFIDSLAVSTNELVGRAGGNLGGLAVTEQSIVARTSGDITNLAVGTDEVVARDDGDLGTVALAEMEVLGRLTGAHVDGITVTTTVADPGVDTKLATEKAIRDLVEARTTASGRSTWAEFLVLAGLS